MVAKPGKPFIDSSKQARCSIPGVKSSASELFLHRQPQGELILFCDPNRNVIIFSIVFNNSLTPAHDGSVDDETKIDEITGVRARATLSNDTQPILFGTTKMDFAP